MILQLKSDHRSLPWRNVTKLLSLYLHTSLDAQDKRLWTPVLDLLPYHQRTSNMVLTRPAIENYGFYCGGGTFDVSILIKATAAFEIKATNGNNNNLGGERL